jgi:AcrR family transcriptional regulator
VIDGGHPRKVSRSPRSLGSDSKASEMLPAIVEFFRARGPEGFSLAAIAEELGTSSRMLIYHFGGRDELLSRVMKLVRRDTILYLEDPPPDDVDEAIRRFWSYYIHMGHLSDMQLFFHIASRRAEEPERYDDFASTAVEGWTQYFANAIEKDGKNSAAATKLGRLVIAALRGIVVDYLVTRDVADAERSLSLFCESIRLLMENDALLEEPARATVPRKRAAAAKATPAKATPKPKAKR